MKVLTIFDVFRASWLFVLLTLPIFYAENVFTQEVVAQNTANITENGNSTISSLSGRSFGIAPPRSVDQVRYKGVKLELVPMGDTVILECPSLAGRQRPQTSNTGNAAVETIRRVGWTTPSRSGIIYEQQDEFQVLQDGSLRIRNVNRQAHSGNYTCIIESTITVNNNPVFLTDARVATLSVLPRLTPTASDYLRRLYTGLVTAAICAAVLITVYFISNYSWEKRHGLDTHSQELKDAEAAAPVILTANGVNDLSMRNLADDKIAITMLNGRDSMDMCNVNRAVSFTTTATIESDREFDSNEDKSQAKQFPYIDGDESISNLEEQKTQEKEAAEKVFNRKKCSLGSGSMKSAISNGSVAAPSYSSLSSAAEEKAKSSAAEAGRN